MTQYRIPLLLALSSWTGLWVCLLGTGAVDWAGAAALMVPWLVFAWAAQRPA
ncbi:MAG: hypothetical protein AAFQ82_26500 [Myxococcota bacterium]